jgi:hypothetical protein
MMASSPALLFPQCTLKAAPSPGSLPQVNLSGASIEYSSMPDKSLLNQLETSGEQHKDDKAHNGSSSGKSETTKISFIRNCG